MIVRFFGGWDFANKGALSREPGGTGCDKGVPMGGDLTKAPEGKAPNFLVAAAKDPYSGNLDRIQIIKGWMDADSKIHEKVYDAVWSGDRKPDSNDNLPTVGSTVDVTNATWTNTTGAPGMTTVWADPEFDPGQRAFYYARVLEIPVPRWTAYEAKRFNVQMPKEVPMTTQERTYTCPIWYTPQSEGQVASKSWRKSAPREPGADAEHLRAGAKRRKPPKRGIPAAFFKVPLRRVKTLDEEKIADVAAYTS